MAARVDYVHAAPPYTPYTHTPSTHKPFQHLHHEQEQQRLKQVQHGAAKVVEQQQQQQHAYTPLLPHTNTRSLAHSHSPHALSLTHSHPLSQRQQHLHLQHLRHTPQLERYLAQQERDRRTQHCASSTVPAAAVTLPVGVGGLITQSGVGLGSARGREGEASNLALCDLPCPAAGGGGGGGGSHMHRNLSMYTGDADMESVGESNLRPGPTAPLIELLRYSFAHTHSHE